MYNFPVQFLTLFIETTQAVVTCLLLTNSDSSQRTLSLFTFLNSTSEKVNAHNA